VLEVEVYDTSRVDILDTEGNLFEDHAGFRLGETVDTLAFEVAKDVTPLHEFCDDVGLESKTELFHQLHHVGTFIAARLRCRALRNTVLSLQALVRFCFNDLDCHSFTRCSVSTEAHGVGGVFRLLVADFILVKLVFEALGI
jgi:hypothetical protein